MGMLARLWALPALLALACGGADDQPTFDQPELTASGGSGAGAASQQVTAGTGGGSTAVAGQPSAGAPTAGTAGTPAATTGGAGAASGGLGGASQGGGGAAPTAGTAAAGGGAGGSSGKPSGGSAGAAQAGSGGQAVDPLEPQPVPGCPGYVKILVPHGTCVWLHGSFTFQTPECNDPEPTEKKCATVSAVSKDTSSIVSASAEISRFDFDQSGCPKQCN